MGPMVEQEARTDLGDLVRNRRAELGLSLRSCAALCIDPETSTQPFQYGWIDKLEKHRSDIATPELSWLRALAAGLSLPLRVVQEAAAAQFWRMTPSSEPVWSASGEGRILVARMEQLSASDRQILADLAESLSRRNANPSDDTEAQ